MKGFKRFAKISVPFFALGASLPARADITIPDISQYQNIIEGIITMGLGALVFLAVGGILYKLVKKIS